MLMTMTYWVVVLGAVQIGSRSVIALNSRLARSEENLLYSYLKNQTNLQLFYEKLIRSNDVEDTAHARQVVTDDDIRQGTIEHKVSKEILIIGGNILKVHLMSVGDGGGVRRMKDNRAPSSSFSDAHRALVTFVVFISVSNQQMICSMRSISNQQTRIPLWVEQTCNGCFRR